MPDNIATLPPALYIVATPIGNLKDITIRALETLSSVDYIICEDSRVSRRLLDHYDIKKPLLTYHEHNAEQMRPVILEHLSAGKSVALISDAGTPLISDPGYKLVNAAIANSYKVVPLPGPSAILAGLVASGLPTDRFLFTGFLPNRSAARRQSLMQLADIKASLVVMESPQRLTAFLVDALAVIGERQAVVARELTKYFEEIKRGSLSELLCYYQEMPMPKGEVVVIIAPPLDNNKVSDAQIDTALKLEMETNPPSTAATLVAANLGINKRLVYRRALALKEQ